MSAVTQSRALAGCRTTAFGQYRPSSKVSHAANGSKWFMRRKDSFMVEVQVGEDEPEDQAVRRFMKSVVQSGVINQVRARRTKETKIDTYKRKLQERAMARKLGILEPTWEDFYGDDGEPKPFEEFFVQDNEDMDIFADMQPNELELFRDQPFYEPLPGFAGAATNDDMFELKGYEARGSGYGYSTDLLANAAAGQGGFNNGFNSQ